MLSLTVLHRTCRSRAARPRKCLRASAGQTAGSERTSDQALGRAAQHPGASRLEGLRGPPQLRLLVERRRGVAPGCAGGGPQAQSARVVTPRRGHCIQPRLPPVAPTACDCPLNYDSAQATSQRNHLQLKSKRLNFVRKLKSGFLHFPSVLSRMPESVQLQRLK